MVPEGEAPLHTVGAMAARHLRQILQVQPQGPYRIAGWSFGGVLAHEIAAQLLARGERVEFLGLIDAFCPDEGIDTGARSALDELLDLCAPTEADRLTLAAPASFDDAFDRCRELGLLPDNFQPLSAQEAQAQEAQAQEARAQQGFSTRACS